MAEFEVSGEKYKSKKMDTFRQFHVARRMAPLLSGIGEAYKKYMDSGKDALVMIEPAAAALASLSDKDSEYIIHSFLGVCQRFQGEGSNGIWTNVMYGERLMFEDIDMGPMLQICFHVMEENLGNFFAALPGGIADIIKGHL